MASLRSIIQEMNLYHTFKNRKERDYKEYPILSVKALTFTGWLKREALMFKAEVEGSTGDRKLSSLLFLGIKYSESSSYQFPFRIIIAGKEWFASLPTMDNQCLLRCSCPDAVYTWSHVLSDKKAWIGPVTRYKVKGTGYQRNPERKMGFCKHIWAVIYMLQQGKVLR